MGRGRAVLRTRVVAQREMEVLDVMTANRDKVVWAAAQGKTIKPDDSNLPPFIPLLEIALPTYEPDQCPLCAQGLPVVKPGSRPVVA